MKIKLGVVGCGNQFRDIYFEVIKKLVNENKIIVQNIYTRNTDKILDIKDYFNCEITNNIDDLLYDEEINFLILSVPLKERNKIYRKKLLKVNYLLGEVPFSNHLGEYFFLKKKINKKKINFEVFEDRYYYNYVINRPDNIKTIINNNKEWMHHSIAQVFNLKKDVGNLLKIKYDIKNAKNDVFKIYFSKLNFIYKFSKNKYLADRENGYIKIIDYKNKLVKYDLKKNIFTNKQQAFYNCILNLIDNQRTKEDLYSNKFLKKENILISLMKLMKKFRIKKLDKKIIDIIEKLFFFYSLFYNFFSKTRIFFK